MKSKWLDWKSGAAIVVGSEPTEPTKLGSVGFVGAPPPLFPITRDSGAATSQRMEHQVPVSTVPTTATQMVTTVNQAATVCASNLINEPNWRPQAPPVNTPLLNGLLPGTKIPLPVGVRLVGYIPSWPSTQKGIKIVDKPKYIKMLLADLDARLHHPIQIRGGDSVFEILDKLADLGLELAIERPAPPPADRSVAASAEDANLMPQGAQPEGGAQ
jgi:hypothetical protein